MILVLLLRDVYNGRKSVVDPAAVCRQLVAKGDDLFTEHFPNQPKPDASIIKRCNDRFKATGNVSEVKTGPRPRDTPLTDVAILAAVEVDPTASSWTTIGVWLPQLQNPRTPGITSWGCDAALRIYADSVGNDQR